MAQHPKQITSEVKKGYSSLLDVPPQAADFWRDLIATVQDLVREFHLETGGYRLITNGGSYQDVPQLHFHLVSDVRSQP